VVDANSKAVAEDPLGIQVTRALREGAMWLLLCFSAYLVVSLASYFPDDPGWSYTGASEAVQNLGGRAGAWFADVALYLFGFCAYFFPAMVAWSAYLVLRRRDPDQSRDLYLLPVRWIGFIVMLSASSALLSIHGMDLGPQLPNGPGGALGGALAERLIEPFSRTGSTLFLVAAELGGFTLCTGLSWFVVMEMVGGAILALGSWVQGMLGAIRVRKRGSFSSARAAPEIIIEPTLDLPRLIPDVEPEPATEAELIPEPESPRAEKKPRPAARQGRQAEAPRAVAPASPFEIEEFADQTELDIGRSFMRPDTSGYTVQEGALPPLSLLSPAPEIQKAHTPEALEELSRLVEARLADFGVEVEVVAVHPGPVVTLFELQLAAGTKVSKITNLSKDLARALSTISVRVVEVIPGKSVIGLEIPNAKRETVYLTEILASDPYQQAESMLTIALGKDIAGATVVADLGRMPHALIAGTTGSGKSVAINAMVLSFLYKAPPSDVRLIMIDPKMLELSVYEGIPHLLTPVVTDMKEAANALRWCVGEMERRYRLMAALGVRNIGGYNRKVDEAERRGKPIPDPFYVAPSLDAFEAGERPALRHLPYIVVIIDELADMMMVVGKKVEELIARLAQKARASGIHLLLATQRPSVDVLTGLIKANIPTRMAFQVSSRVDSRTILDQMGAEQLLGHGDMLYMAPGSSFLRRIHGAFVDDNEVHRVVEFLRATGEPDYIQSVLEESTEAIPGVSDEGGGVEDSDPLFDEAVRIVTESRRASISGVQRRLKIGYNRAARMIEEMERIGIVGPAESNGSREVLAPPPPED